MTEEEIEIEAQIYTKEKHCKDGCRNIPNCWENDIEDCCMACRETNADFIAGAKWGMERLREDFQQGKITCAGMTIQEIMNLKKENEELKKEKIPHLERRIASSRGNIRVLNEKLKCRLEQVERLRSERAETTLQRNQLREEKEQLKKQLAEMTKDRDKWKQRAIDTYCEC